MADPCPTCGLKEDPATFREMARVCGVAVLSINAGELKHATEIIDGLRTLFEAEAVRQAAMRGQE